MENEKILKDWIEKVEEDLSCTVCCQTNSASSILTCGHTLCNECITKLKKGNDTLNCPFCRQTVVISMKSYDRENMFEKLQQLKKEKTEIIIEEINSNANINTNINANENTNANANISTNERLKLLQYKNNKKEELKVLKQNSPSISQVLCGTKNPCVIFLVVFFLILPIIISVSICSVALNYKIQNDEWTETVCIVKSVGENSLETDTTQVDWKVKYRHYGDSLVDGIITEIFVHDWDSIEDIPPYSVGYMGTCFFSSSYDTPILKWNTPYSQDQIKSLAVNAGIIMSCWVVSFIVYLIIRCSSCCCVFGRNSINHPIYILP